MTFYHQFLGRMDPAPCSRAGDAAAWLRRLQQSDSSGIEVSPFVGVVAHGGSKGLGLVAESGANAGSCVVRVGLTAALTSGRALTRFSRKDSNDRFAGIAQALQSCDCAAFTALVLALCAERALGEEESAPFRDYVRCLPGSDDLHSTEAGAGGRVAAAWSYCQGEVAPRVAAVAEDVAFSRRAFAWAANIVITRAFSMANAGAVRPQICLLPAVDLMNHASQGSPQHNVELGRDAAGAFVARLRRPCKAGEELCICYGAQESLLSQHGLPEAG